MDIETLDDLLEMCDELSEHLENSLDCFKKIENEILRMRDELTDTD